MYPDDALLRRSLKLNAGFSAASAVVLAVAAQPLGRALGSVPSVVLYAVAALLAAFAVDLFVIARGEPLNPLRAAAATGADLIWVAGSAVVLFLRPDVLSRTGLAIVAGVGLVVLLVAGLQAAGLRRYARNRRGETGEASMFSMTLTLDAPAQAVWELVRDLERIGDFYDLLANVEVEDDGGRAVRTCEDRKGRRWSEEVLEMDDETRSLTVRFVSEADDFPFPMTSMVGGWTVSGAGAGSRLTLWYEYTLPGGPVGEIAAALTGPVLEKRMAPVIRQMEAAAADPGGVRKG